MTKLVVDVDVQGSEIVITARGEGLRSGASATAVTEPSKWTPAEGGGAVAINVSGEPFWRWMESATTEPAPTTSLTQRHGITLLREGIKQLQLYKFPSEVLPKVNGPLTILYGTATGMSGMTQGRTIGVGALVFKSSDPSGAMESLSRLCREAIQESKEVQWVTETEQGFALGYARFPETFGYTDYKRPCVAVVNDFIVFANNLDFIRSVLATAAGQGVSLVEQDLFKGAVRRMAGVGMKKVLGDGLIATGFISGGAIRDGLSGYIPMLAEDAENSSESMRKLRQEIVAEFQREGRPLNDKEITEAVYARMDVRVEESVKTMQGAMRPLDYVRYAAVEAERAGEEAVVVRGVVSVRGR
jgi:hypothetical protein